MLKNYKEGADITILDARYTYPKKNQSGKYDDGSIDIIFKDNATGKKHVETIFNPESEFYVVKEEFRVPYNRLYAPIDELDVVVTPFKDIKKNIATVLGKEKEYFDNIRNGQYKLNDYFHESPDIFYSDYSIEDFYRKKFAELYKNDIFAITKCYLDIEVDIINAMGDFVELGECPINVVTLVNDVTKTIYTLILKDSNNPLVEAFGSIANTTFPNEVKDFIKGELGDAYSSIYGLDEFNLKINFYDEEIQLIYDIFNIINQTQPDFVLAWNMAFDIPYLVERIKVLGYTPESIMCHSDFKLKKVKYFIDDKTMDGKMKAFAERGDFYEISSYSIYADQLVHFASRRKATTFSTYKLDYIGGRIAKVRKLDFSHIANSFAKFPYTDFKTFVMYNIMDTIVQKCVEMKINDIEYIFTKCILNNTRYNKIHRQTVYLMNSITKTFKNDLNIIRGNNTNKRNTKTSFPGGFVADPTLNTDFSKKKIGGRSVDVYDNADDYDYTALYPSIIEEFNTAPNTQVGMIQIPDKIHNKENLFNKDYYSRSGAFLEDIHSREFLEIGTRWFNLGDYKDIYKDIVEFYTEIEFDRSIYRYNIDGTSDVFVPNKPTNIFREFSYSNLYVPIIKPMNKEFANKTSSEIKIEEVVRNV